MIFEYSPGLILTIWAVALVLFGADPAGTAAPFIAAESTAVFAYIATVRRKLR